MTTEADVRPRPGTLVIWGDIACPWSSLAVHRLHAARKRLGLTDRVRLDMRAFALELINSRCSPKRTYDAEVACIGAHEPELEWQPWVRPEHEYPGTVLTALSAVQAAKTPEAGGLPASEELDWALRRAFFAESRPISLWSEVMDIAADCPSLDVDALTTAMRAGTGLAAVLDQVAVAESEAVKGSPHVFCPDGIDAHNPGLQISWTKGKGRGFPQIVSDDPSVYDDLLTRSVGG